MSNFACIGFTGEDEALHDHMNTAVRAARPDAPTLHGVEHLLWTDPSGAAMAFHMKGADLDCVTPFFKGAPTTWRVRTHEPLADPGCRHCSGADCDVLDASDEMVTRCALQWLHFDPWVGFLSQEQTFEVAVVAFAHRAIVTADGGRAVEGSEMTFAPNYFVPTGMFEDMGPHGMRARATAEFGGAILSLDRRTNGLAGGDFWWALVDALPGPTNVVLPVDAAEGVPTVGANLRVYAWMVCDPVADPPPVPQEPGGWFSRLFGT